MANSHSLYNEYEALRSELLLLINRSLDLWKWSLASIFVLTGTVVFAVFSKSPELLEIVKNQPWLLSAVLMVFVSGTVWTLSDMLIDLEVTRDRLGAYLAIFHDQDLEPLCDKYIGLRYHIWNRIDQYVPHPSDTNLQPPQSGFYGLSRRLGVYLLIEVTLALIIFVLLSAIANTVLWDVLFVGMAFSFFVGLWLRLLEKKMGKSFQYWNYRWLQLRRLPEKEIQSALATAGLDLSCAASEIKKDEALNHANAANS